MTPKFIFNRSIVPHASNYVADARPSIGYTSEGKFLRLAVEVPQGDTQSIDIVSPNGALLMRLNLFNHGDDIGQSIDVIFDVKNTTTFAVQSWNGGARVLREIVTGSLVSVSRAKIETVE